MSLLTAVAAPVAQPAVGAVVPGITAGTAERVVISAVQVGQAQPGQLARVDVWADGAAAVAAFEIVATVDPRAGRIEYAESDEAAVPAGHRDDLSLSDVTGYGVLAGYSPVGRGSGLERVRLGSIYVRPVSAGAVEVRLGSVMVADGAGRLLRADADRVVSLVVGGGSASGQRWPAPPAPWILPPQSQAQRWSDAPVELQLRWQTSRIAAEPCRGRRAAEVGGCIDIGDVQRFASSPEQLASGGPVPAGPADLRSRSVVPTLAAPLTFVVNSEGDSSDSRIGNGVCRTAAGNCSLRAAIQEANVHLGPDTIRFDIAGTAPFRIQLGTRLPALNDRSGPTTIDGFSQPGARPNTDPLVSNAVIPVQIVGGGTDAFDAMAITSPGNVVRGLSIHTARRPIWIFRTGKGSVGNVIQGCVIGTNPGGTVVAPALVNLGHGLHIEQDSPNTLVGGTDPADRNVISGNARHGVGVWHSWSDGTVIQGNIVGLSPDGTRVVPNRKHGLDVNFGASGTLIGGTAPGAGNLVSGNDDDAVEISHTTATTANRVIGNRLGTDASGEYASWSGNLNHGVWIEDGANNNTISDNVIGGNAKGGIRIISGPNGDSSQNVIRNNLISVSREGRPIPNGQAGIIVDAPDNVVASNRIVYQQGPGIVSTASVAQRNTFTRNIIHALPADRLAIDLAPRGRVNLNDPGDADDGPNSLVNFPDIEAATTSVVRGSACAGCTVEVFWTGGGAGYGPARDFLGSSVAGGDGNWRVDVSVVSGRWVSATTTTPDGATSEMSANVRVQ